jgi:hypothetical protein
MNPKKGSRNSSTGKNKGRGKVVLVFFVAEHRAIKAHWGSGVTAPRIL